MKILCACWSGEMVERKANVGREREFGARVYARRIGKKLRQKRNGRKKSCSVPAHCLPCTTTTSTHGTATTAQLPSPDCRPLDEPFPGCFFACLFSFFFPPHQTLFAVREKKESCFFCLVVCHTGVAKKIKGKIIKRKNVVGQIRG